MLFGPVFTLNLQTTARRWRFFAVRLAYVLILFIAVLLEYYSYYSQAQYAGYGGVSRSGQANFANEFFTTFAVLQMLVVLLVTPALVATTIAQERERRTLDYLLTCPLSASEIVLGKLGARLLDMFATLIAGWPILALLHFLGGIEFSAIVRTSGLALLVLLFTGGVSLLISVWSPRSRDAILRVYLLELLLLCVPPFYSSFLLGWHVPIVGEICDVLAALNPLFGQFEIIISRAPWDGAWQELIWFVSAYLGGAIVCTALAAASLRRAYRTTVLVGTRPPRWRLPRLKLPLGDAPMFWKECFSNSATARLGWLGRIVVALLLLAFGGGSLAMLIFALSVPYGKEVLASYCWTMGTLLASLALLYIGGRAAVSIASERDRDTWISLLTTDLNEREILAAKALGSAYSARWLVFLAGGLYVVGQGLHPIGLFAVPITAGIFLLLAAFSTMLGLLFSLSLKTGGRAIGVTLGLQLVVGGGYLFCCFPMFFVGDENVILMFAPCAMFLLLAPSVIATQMEYAGATTQPEFVVTIMSFCFGVTGYLMATAGLAIATGQGFNRLAGRCSRRIAPPKPPRDADVPREAPVNAILLPENKDPV